MTTTTTVLLGIDGLALLGTMVAGRRKSWTISFLCAVITVALAYTLLGATTLLALGVALVVLAGVVVWVRRSSGRTAARWGRRSGRKLGMASQWDIARRGSAVRYRSKATAVRPSMEALTRWDRLRTPVREFAIPLCRVGGQRLYASVEHAIMVVGAPRTGKSGWIAERVIESPGAALVTSTRADLHRLTHRARERKSGPTYVFNAGGMGKLENTIHFNPLHGCKDPVTASERAEDLVAGAVALGAPSTASGDRETWNAQARRVLTTLLHAAALGGRDMDDLSRWVSSPLEHKGEIMRALGGSLMPAAFMHDLTQFTSTNERTATSITTTLSLSLHWLLSPSARAAAFGAEQFDVAKLLAERATVYLLGRKEAHAAPLVCALTGHIAREARRLAANSRAGRLDPPLRLVLDEAANISPVPLDEWTSDMGGSGVTIIAGFQSRAQMQSIWGEHRAAVMLNNAAAVLVYGGGKSHEENEHWSSLAGERDEEVLTRDAAGRVLSRTVRRVPVITTTRLANLPTNRVLAFAPGTDPCIGRVRMAWKRRDVRRDLRVLAQQDALAEQGGTLLREAFDGEDRAAELVAGERDSE